MSRELIYTPISQPNLEDETSTDVNKPLIISNNTLLKCARIDILKDMFMLNPTLLDNIDVDDIYDIDEIVYVENIYQYWKNEKEFDPLFKPIKELLFPSRSSSSS